MNEEHRATVFFVFWTTKTLHTPIFTRNNTNSIKHIKRNARAQAHILWTAIPAAHKRKLRIANLRKHPRLTKHTQPKIHGNAQGKNIRLMTSRNIRDGRPLTYFGCQHLCLGYTSNIYDFLDFTVGAYLLRATVLLGARWPNSFPSPWRPSLPYDTPVCFRMGRIFWSLDGCWLTTVLACLT